MGRYIKEYQTENDVQTAIDNGELLKPYVAYIESSNTIDWDSKFINYSAMPLTFKITSDGDIKIGYSNCGIEYSLNGGEWTVGDNVTLNVVSGDLIKFKLHEWDKCYQLFKNSSAAFNVYGNIYYNVTTLDLDCREMFANCTGLTDASNLILPATTLTNGCYSRMFEGCSNLTTAPSVLPATTLEINCYSSMFAYCTSLATAPELPATTLANRCYNHMFGGCSNLTTAPELPATTLAEGCYLGMFYNCRNLNYIKCLATDKSASNCTENWVSGVQTNSGTFVKNPNMSSWSTGNSGIPNNWTVQDAS